MPLGAAIVAVDGKPVESPLALADLIRQLKVGATIDLTCIVRGQEMHKRVTLTAAPPQPETRAKPLASPADLPAVSPPAVSPPGFVPQEAPALGPPGIPASDDARLDALERRIAELEARIEKLEAQLSDKQ